MRTLNEGLLTVGICFAGPSHNSTTSSKQKPEISFVHSKGTMLEVMPRDPYSSCGLTLTNYRYAVEHTTGEQIPSSSFVVQRKKSTGKKKKSMDNQHFPTILHDMLTSIDKAGSEEGAIISFQPHGKCFLIKQKEEFIARILPR